MLKFKLLYPLLSILPLLFLSCWGNSSPTSDKSTAYQVSGSVADKNGIGIGGVTVQITRTNFSISDTTDSGGAFIFENVKTGSYKIHALKDNCFFSPADIDLSGVKSDIDTLKFTSVDSYIHGKVLDIMTDKGIAGVKVIFGAKKELGNNIGLDSLITDNNGEYEFFDLLKDDYIEYYITIINTNFEDWEMISGYNIYKPGFFTGAETIIPTYYLSSEKLRITKGEYSSKTKTVYLEWTPSESPYSNGYLIYYRKYPLGQLGPDHKGSAVSSSGTNNISIKINPKSMLLFYDGNVFSGDMFFNLEFPDACVGDE